jgi:hypothetical protein
MLAVRQSLLWPSNYFCGARYFNFFFMLATVPLYSTAVSETAAIRFSATTDWGAWWREV